MWAAIANAVGQIGSAGISAGSSNLSSRKAFQRQQVLQREAAKLNYDYSLAFLKNSPLRARQGLEKSGYNPMLAVQNGTIGSNASSFTSPGQAPQHDMSAALSNVADYQRVMNETHVSETTADLNESQAQEARARAVKQELENPYVSQRQEAEIGKLSAETVNINRSTEYYEALEHNMEVMQRLQQMGINVTRELGYAGFANAKDIANINAGVTRVGPVSINTDKWYNAAKQYFEKYSKR